MRKAVSLFACLLLASACGGATETQSSQPSVLIDSADIVDSAVTLVFSASAADEAPVISVSWGDGSNNPDFAGEGEFVLTHTYDDDVTSATISVEATGSDGTVAGDTARLEITPPSTTTSSTTSTTTSTTSTTPSTTTTSTTTTTVPETTTTTTAATTTTSQATTTTTAATTSTTEREARSTRFAINVASGYIVDQWGGGLLESDWDGDTADAKVQRHEDTWESDGILVAWDIPRSDYVDLLEDAAGLRFSFTADIRIDYELDTDATAGNEAELFVEMTGKSFLGSAGDSFRDSIDADDYSGFLSSKTMQGWWVVHDNILESQRITLELECSAKGPGGILVTSDSECDGAVSLVGEFDVTVTEIP